MNLNYKGDFKSWYKFGGVSPVTRMWKKFSQTCISTQFIRTIWRNSHSTYFTYRNITEVFQLIYITEVFPSCQMDDSSTIGNFIIKTKISKSSHCQTEYLIIIVEISVDTNQDTRQYREGIAHEPEYGWWQQACGQLGINWSLKCMIHIHLIESMLMLSIHC